MLREARFDALRQRLSWNSLRQKMCGTEKNLEAAVAIRGQIAYSDHGAT
jgi:hypothetical protein